MIYVIMGVSGCGKSSFGAFLSEKLGWPLHEGDDFHPQENIDKMARGEPLTDQLGWPLHEGDDFHPQENIDKMARGEPLTDQDRLPWLLKLHEVIERERSSSCDALVVCSALKHLYRHILLHGSKALASPSSPNRDILRPATPDVFFIFLHGDFDLIHQRMVDRMGHYMKADLLRSQFDVLEPPLEEENFLTLDIRRSISDMAVEVEAHITSLRSIP